MMSRRLFTSLAVLCMVLVVTPAEARKKKTLNTEPGTYKEWGPNIDEIEIVNTFEAASYKSIVVIPLATDEVKLPGKDDNTFEPVTKILASATEPFVKALQEHQPAKVVVDAKPGRDAETLIIRAKVVTMDPGSQAKRYFAGFGAGAARTKITGEIVDAKTKGVLVRFTQERRSGVGMMGGGYEALMNRNLRAIGEDVANILKSF